MIILFDLDGTLADSGEKITHEMYCIMKKIKNKYNCTYGIVGGGNYNKIIYQVGNYDDIFNYIFSECGSVIYKNNCTSWDCIFKKSMMDEVKNNELMSENLDYLKKIFIEEININNIKTMGNNIDVRSGLIYLSIPGMSATSEIRNNFFEFNKKNNFISRTLEKLKFISKYFEISKGGEAGFSLTLPGWDKSQVIDLLYDMDISDDNIYFFGDKCDIDGNDYSLYSHRLVKGYCVKNYHDTINKLYSIFINEGLKVI